MDRYDVIIVGGGLSGWTAAAFAARAGLRAALMEKSHTPGGRARTLTEKGTALNLGAHAVYRDGELMASLHELAIAVPGHVPPFAGHGVYRGKVYPLPASPGALAFSPLLRMRGKFDLARLTTVLRRFDTKRPPRGPFQLWVESHTADPMVRTLIYTLARTCTYVPDPSRLPAASVMRQLKHVFNGGALYVDGGWGTLIDGVRNVAQRHGAQEWTGSPVGRVDAGPPFAIHRADGPSIYADRVILAIPPAVASSLIHGPPVPSLSAWCRQAKPIEGAGSADPSGFAGPRVPEIPGLYIAGDWTGHGELLADAAAASARRAVRALLADGKQHAA